MKVPSGREFAERWVEESTMEALEVFKEVYLFAKDNSGMNRGRDNAHDFAATWIEEHSNSDFRDFKKAYIFARNEMKKSRQDSEDYAFDQID